MKKNTIPSPYTFGEIIWWRNLTSRGFTRQEEYLPGIFVRSNRKTYTIVVVDSDGQSGQCFIHPEDTRPMDKGMFHQIDINLQKVRQFLFAQHYGTEVEK
jgi:hypothetical protein